MAHGLLTGRLPAAIAGLIIGMLVGMMIGWAVWPVQFTNAEPADLRTLIKDDYIRMISAAYALDGSLADAKERLSRIGLTAPVQAINGLIVRERQTNSSIPTREALVRMALALSSPLPAQSSGSDAYPAVVSTAATQPVPAFRLLERTMLTCSDEPDSAHLRVVVRDSNGQDMPNVAIEIRWTNGDETIYTGLKPERGIGYADFQAAPGAYSVLIANSSGDSVPDLKIGEPPADCKADRTTARGWRLLFQQK